MNFIKISLTASIYAIFEIIMAFIYEIVFPISGIEKNK